MKKRVFLVFALILIVSFISQNTVCGETSKDSGSGSFTVMTDPRIELMSLIFRLAGNPEYSKGSIVSYNKNINVYFAKYKDHAVVQKARKLRETRGVSFDAVMNMAVHLTDAYTLQEKVPFAPRPISLDNRWKIIEAREFLYDARCFVKQTKFKRFIHKHRKLYHTTVSRIQQLLQNGRLDWFDSFFGRRAHAGFIIVPGLLNNGHSYGVRIRLNDGSEELYCILGVWLKDKKGLPFFDTSVVSTIVHEFCHSFANPLVDKYQPQLKKAGKIIFPYVAEAMKKQHYPDWQIMMYESLVRACVVRYIHAVNGQDAAKKQISQEIKNQFPWMEKLSILLAEYETRRKDYPTLDSFFPGIIAFFNEYARDLKKTPRILSMVPANETVDVDPQLQLIVIHFDRPMRDHSWSVVGAGPHFLQINGKPYYHSEKRIFCIPVKLKPGWQYEFWLNYRKHLEFASAEGVPLIPYHVRFNTRGN